MENIVVKNTLSYSLGSDIHEACRVSRKQSYGTFGPRIKNLMMKHGI